MEEEAGGCAEKEEEMDHERVDSVAVSVAVDGRENHFEHQESSCRKEVDDHRCL